jgi:D-alanyl-D-alanine carboxypeptidase
MRFLYFTLFILVFSLVTDAQLNIQDALRQLQTDPTLKGSQWSVCALDMETGDTIAQWNPDLALPGASITKLFSTAAALAT